MYTHADKTQEKKSQSVADANSQKKGSSESTFQFVDNRPETIAQRKLHEMANNSPRSIQLKAFPKISDNSSKAQTEQLPEMQLITFKQSSDNKNHTKSTENNVIQRFSINQYDDYDDYLAGEDTIRSTQRVKEMIRILRQGGELSNDEPIKASKNVEVVKETNDEMPWQYIAKDEYEGDDEPETLNRHILSDGHHRFVAYVETNTPLPGIQDDLGMGQFGYSWRTMGGMEEEYDLEDEGPLVDEQVGDEQAVQDKFELDSGEIKYDEWSHIAREAMTQVEITRQLDRPIENLLELAYEAGYTANMFAEMMENGTW